MHWWCHVCAIPRYNIIYVWLLYVYWLLTCLTHIDESIVIIIIINILLLTLLLLLFMVSVACRSFRGWQMTWCKEGPHSLDPHPPTWSRTSGPSCPLSSLTLHPWVTSLPPSSPPTPFPVLLPIMQLLSKQDLSPFVYSPPPLHQLCFTFALQSHACFSQAALAPSHTSCWQTETAQTLPFRGSLTSPCVKVCNFIPAGLLR